MPLGHTALHSLSEPGTQNELSPPQLAFVLPLEYLVVTSSVTMVQ